ncbi:MAG: nickel pincer cofactor biosynthesis protein LarB [Nitrospinota bacterium]
MNRAALRHLLEGVRRGELSTEEALAQLRSLPFEDLGFAKVDNHRPLRSGYPEVVFAQGKTPEQVVSIVEHLAGHHEDVLVTRVEPPAAAALQSAFPSCEVHPPARIVVVNPAQGRARVGNIAVVSGGTADMPVAEEASVTAETFGSRVNRMYDVGVAGLHRLLSQKQALFEANVVVAVAGMDGALGSVVAGMVDKPVIAVPTSVGYGASFGGLAALLGMLNSCASGVSVVNIDNGFGAAYQADMINKLCVR